jgi:hypothetical protein
MDFLGRDRDGKLQIVSGLKQVLTLSSYLLLRVSRLFVEPFDKVKRGVNVVLKVLPQPVGTLVEYWLQCRLSNSVDHKDVDQDALLLQVIPDFLGLIPVEDITGTCSDSRVGEVLIKLQSCSTSNILTTSQYNHTGCTSNTIVPCDCMAYTCRATTDKDSSALLRQLCSLGRDYIIRLVMVTLFDVSMLMILCRTWSIRW